MFVNGAFSYPHKLGEDKLLRNMATELWNISGVITKAVSSIRCRSRSTDGTVLIPMACRKYSSSLRKRVGVFDKIAW